MISTGEFYAIARLPLKIRERGGNLRHRGCRLTTNFSGSCGYTRPRTAGGKER